MVWIFRARVRAQMNATPPEAKPEYSRADSPSEGVSGVSAAPDRGVGPGGGAALRIVVWGAGLLGAALLVIAEFTNLFTVHTALSSGQLASMKTGSHNSYALIPIAVLALLLTVSGWRARSRPALAALAALGLIALLIEPKRWSLPRDRRGHRVADRRRAWPVFDPWPPAGAESEPGSSGKRRMRARARHLHMVALLTICDQSGLLKGRALHLGNARVVPPQPPVPCGGRPSPYLCLGVSGAEWADGRSGRGRAQVGVGRAGARPRLVTPVHRVENFRGVEGFSALSALGTANVENRWRRPAIFHTTRSAWSDNATNRSGAE
jgi:hypothetical protein